MAFCSKCGAELAEGARFCASCGTATDQSGASPAGPAAPPHAGTTAQSQRPSPSVPPYGNTAPPIITPARPGGIGWILPAIILIALGVIGYLLLAPGAKKSITDGVKTEEAAKGETGGDGDAAAAAAASAARTADRVADEAAVARRNALGTPNYVTAATLDAVYNADPAGAAVRYPGRVRVTGVIASMVSPGSNPSLSMEGRTPFNFMVVNFPDGYRTRLIPLMKGQTISVLCDDVRSLAGTTILSGCLLD